MKISDFTNIFLPLLAKEYATSHMELHSLVDLELWKQIFPDSINSQEGDFRWYQIRLNCFEMKDHTLLLTYTLPTPITRGEPKFAGIRLNRQTREVHYYVLTKPQSVDDPWDILWAPFPKASEKMKLEFKCKIDGTDSLRNFVLSVQQQEFKDTSYGSNLLSSLLRHLKDTIVPME